MKTISKVLSIVLCLAMVMALFVVGASADATKNVVAAGSNTADFSALKETGVKDTSYGARSSMDGWTATNSALNGSSWPNDISAIVLNGNKNTAGTLTSGTLTGPLKSITFNYGFPFNDTQFKLTINVKQNGQTVASTVLEKTGLSKETVYSFVWNLDATVTGDFTLEFVNNAKSNSTSSNKDRLAIWGLTWSSSAASEHTHNGEATTVKHNADQHWTEYACGTIKGEKADHTYANGVCSFAGCGQEEPVIAKGDKVTSIADGDKVLIYYPKDGKVLSATNNSSKLAGVNGVVSGTKLSATGAVVLEVKKSGNNYSFVADGKYLSTKDSAGNGLIFVDAPSDYTLWTLETATDGFYIKSVNAVYNSTKPQYFEYYNGNFTSYSFDSSKADIFTFQFFKVDESAPACDHANGYEAKRDANNHWEECKKGCGDIKNIGAHSMAPQKDANQHWNACTCGYATEKVNHDMVTKFDKTHHWTECTCGEKTDKVGHTLSDGKCTCGYEKDVVLGYYKVTNGKLTDGKYVLVIAETKVAAGIMNDKKWVTATTPTISGSQVTNPTDCVWTLDVEGDKVTITDPNGKSITNSGTNIIEGSDTWSWKYENGMFYFYKEAEEGKQPRYLSSNPKGGEGKENFFRAYYLTLEPDSYGNFYHAGFNVYKYGTSGNSNTGDNSVISLAVAAAVLSVMGCAVLVAKKKEF